MTLKAVLEAPDDLLRSLKFRTPAVTALARAVRAINDRGQVSGADEPIADLQERIALAVQNRAIDALRPRELRRSPNGFFDGPRPIARDAATREAVLALIAKRQQKSAVLAAIFQFLERFDPGDLDVVRVGQWLDEIVRQWDWSWRERAVEYELFRAGDAPERLARAVLASDQLPSRVLDDIGLPEAIATGALGEAAFAAACQLTLRSNEADVVRLQQRLIGWGHGGSRFGFDRLFPLYVSALLDPWANVEPPEEHRRVIMRELEEYAGDPRIRSAKWNVIKDRAPSAYDILLRWLTKLSVYQFFDIVDRVADRNMWAYRRAFWTAYLEAGHIEQAWVVFGENGARLARLAAKQSGDKSLGYFGKLESGGGRTPDHAALVMRIGSLTIAEWSHNGKYNIWRSGDRTAPKLFEDRYEPDELRFGTIDGSHSGNEYFSWQQNVARIIRNETRRATNMAAWRPERRRG
jgi:hypothetical protein